MMTVSSEKIARFTRQSLVLAVLAMSASASHALFSDDEARKAILDLRQRVDSVQQRNADEVTQMRRSVLDLQQQIDTLRAEIARLTGQNEQLAREASELQRKQKDIAHGIDERLRQFEPVQVTVDGLQFAADPAEKRDFEAAFEQFRSGQFAEARKLFAAFVNTYPRSGYIPSARFWLGNTQYAGRDYKEAIANFRSMLNAVPNHEKAPEALLAIANCQLEMKDPKAAKKSLEDLLKAYPNSEAAKAGKDRLATIK